MLTEFATRTNCSGAPMPRPATTTQRRPPTPTTASACSQQGARPALVRPTAAGTTVDNDADQDGVCDQDEQPRLYQCCGLQLRRNIRPPTPTTASACSQQGARPALVRPMDQAPPSTTMPTRTACATEMRLLGCTNAAACNYDATPTTDTDNSLCVFATGCQTCSGETDGSRNHR